MTFRTIRISMPDRLGALAAVTTSLAVHRVDIVSLDVVSHEGDSVVDDLVLSAESEDDIRTAVAAFRPEVAVRGFQGLWSDPAVAVGEGLLKVAAADSTEASRDAALRSVTAVGRADQAAWLLIEPNGRIQASAATWAVPAIEPGEPFDGRWAIEQRTPAAFPARPGWATAAFEIALDASWVCVIPIDAFEAVVIGRKPDIPFYKGELARLKAFVQAAAAIVSMRTTERAPFTSLPLLSGAMPPPMSVLLAER